MLNRGVTPESGCKGTTIFRITKLFREKNAFFMKKNIFRVIFYVKIGFTPYYIL